MQQRDDNALAAGAPCGIHRLDHALTVNQQQYVTVTVAAFFDGEHAVAGDQRCRAAREQVVDMRDFQARQFQHVAEALGGKQRQLNALALDHRVHPDGGAMGEVVNIGRVDAVALLECRQPGGDFIAGAVRPRQNFQGADAVIALVEQRKVSKRAADIDANAIGHGVRSSGGVGINSINRSGCATGFQPARR